MKGDGVRLSRGAVPSEDKSLFTCAYVTLTNEVNSTSELCVICEPPKPTLASTKLYQLSLTELPIYASF